MGAVFLFCCRVKRLIIYLQMKKFGYIVIGKGLMGSAAARYLSGWGETAVIGPDEPANWQTHPGVFASHYDQGRITRRLSKDVVWSELAQAAIAQYPTLEAASGISFHGPSGGLYVAPDPNDAYFQLADGWGQQQGVNCARLSPAERQARFPFLDFPAGWPALWEGPPAGYINPRDLIEAQLAGARQQGATVIGETAVTLHRDANSVRVVTDAGQTCRADKVLLATGAFSNCFDLLPRPLPLRVKSEIIILAEVGEAEVERLAGMPTVIYEIESDVLNDIYLLPPIRYPDGRFYLKMGCNTAVDQTLTTLAEMRRWMIAGESDRMLAPMRAALQSIIPDLRANSFQTKRCLITYTPHGKPYIDALQPGRLYAVTGGNGSSAKSSDSLGRMAAELMHEGHWSFNLEPALFKIPDSA
jgi:glycine/D-amino acid oxidase-like deaminating enzyme